MTFRARYSVAQVLSPHGKACELRSAFESCAPPSRVPLTHQSRSSVNPVYFLHVAGEGTLKAPKHCCRWLRQSARDRRANWTQSHFAYSDSRANERGSRVGTDLRTIAGWHRGTEAPPSARAFNRRPSSRSKVIRRSQSQQPLIRNRRQVCGSGYQLPIPTGRPPFRLRSGNSTAHGHVRRGDAGPEQQRGRRGSQSTRSRTASPVPGRSCRAKASTWLSWSGPIARSSFRISKT